MKKFLSLLVACLASATLSFAQVAPNFDIYAFPTRFDVQSEEHFDANGFTIRNIEVMTQGNIVYSTDHSKINPKSIEKYLDRYFPGSGNRGKVVLDWEAGPYRELRDYPATDSRFKAAEAKLIGLVTLIKKLRPNIQVSLYSLPYRTWNTWQKNNYNAPGKYDKLISKLDFITPSLYILFTDEEVGRERNLRYLRENMEPALIYGKKHNKPVIPFVWHRVHFNSKKYGKQIMRKEVMADYIKYVKNYSYDNYRVDGVSWWDDVAGRLNNLKGMDGHLKGKVHDARTYDAMIVDYAKYIKKFLNEGAAPAPAPRSSTGRKGESFTLINADTEQDIMTVANGATLNLSDLPTRNLNIRFNKGSVKMASVRLALSGAQSKTIIEGMAPYALFADDTRGNYYSWTPATGSYTLKATPYSGSKGSGTAGAAYSVSFTISNGLTASSSSNLSAEAASPSFEAVGGVVAYPNPATTQVNVEAGDAGEGAATISLYDFNGKAVLTQEQKLAAGGLKAAVDVSKLQGGLYILEVVTPRGRTSQRIVVE